MAAHHQGNHKRNKFIPLRDRFLFLVRHTKQQTDPSRQSRPAQMGTSEDARHQR